MYGSMAVIPVFHGGALFIVADFAVRRAGGVWLPESRGIFAGKAGGKHQPARARIHRVAADAVGGPAVLPRRTAGDGPGNGGRPGGADAAGAANHAHADRGAPGGGGGGRGDGLRARPPLERINCHDILQALRAGQGQNWRRATAPPAPTVYGEFQKS